MTKKTEISMLSKLLPYHPHNFNTNPTADLDWWVEQNRPYCWTVVWKDKDYSVWADSGYGEIVIFKGTKPVGNGRACVLSDDKKLVVLDSYYTGGDIKVFRAVL